MSLITAIVDALDGNFVPDEVAAQRKQICKKCAFNRGIGTCIKCTCFIALKTLMPQEECPIGKWGQHDNEPLENVIPLI